MTLQVPISPAAEALLREKAAAVGQDISSYAAGVLERVALRPLSISEVSGPLGKSFAASYVVPRDKDRTSLLDTATPAGRDVTTKFPSPRIIEPQE